MKSELKIAILFTHLFLIVVSFGTVAHNVTDMTRIAHENMQPEQVQKLGVPVSIQNQNQSPLSSFPFSEQLDIELEPDEEEIGKNGANQVIPKNKAYSYYHQKSPPVYFLSNREHLITHNPLYILIEVFRL